MPTTYPAGVFLTAGVVQGVSLNFDTATTGSTGANNWLFELLKNNVTVIASRQTDAAEISANTNYALTLSATLADRTVAVNDTRQLKVTKTGNPTDLSAARRSISFRTTKALA